MWLDEDQEAAVAFQRWVDDDERTRCPKGHRRDDWIDPATGRPWRDPAYLVQIEECPCCIALAEALDDITDDDPDRAGKYPVLVPNDPDMEQLHPVEGDD